MFIVFFLLWIVFNERITLEIILLDLCISSLLYLFVVKFMDYSPKKEWQAIKKLPGALKYGFSLVTEIVKANFSVMHFILTPRYQVEPQLVYFRTKLKKDLERVVLANSITLTPGTITVSMEDDLLCVHCLDKTLGEGLDDTDFEKQLLKLEGTEQ